MVDFRGSMIPLISLSRIFEVPDFNEEDESETEIIVIHKGDRLAALAVDEFIGQNEIVLKNLGKYLPQIKGISGATILGDGQVALILDPNGMGEDIKVIVFKLGSEEYGIEVDKVQTIERMLPITRVPKTYTFVRGVINLRGVVIPVIDLRGRFGLPETEYTDQTRIIIVVVGEMEVGFIVDSANDVIDLNRDRIETPPEVVGGIKARYLDGVAKIGDDRLLIMLNLSEVLKKSEIIQLESLEE
ncbi:hypothetical protein BGX30_001089 [Mortierella sp. GBA39]|nr:hypothetical protein BGX30_001089 [Mortierella sp. GBA39]